MANLLSTIVTGGSGTTPTLSLDRNIAAPSNYYNGVQLEIKATSGTAGIGLHRNGFSHVGIYHNAANELRFDMNSGTVILNHNTGTIWGSGNLTNLDQLTNGPGYITSVGNITRLWAESHPTDYYIRANWTGSYWQLTSNHPSPVQVGYADNSGALSGLGVGSFLRDDGWNTSPGQDANTQEQMRVDFTYSNNAPYTGELIRFGSSGYSTQFNTSYGNSDNFAFRTRNGDNATWNAWRNVIHSGNIASQSVSYADESGYSSSTGTTDNIGGVQFRNTGSNAGTNADTIDSNGITYYTAGVANFSGNATDGALYSQRYSTSWQHQIAGDYRSGQIALRGRNNGTWQSWRTVLDSSNFTSWAQEKENQRLSTGNGPTFAEVYTNGWFRNNNINTGLYNQNTGTHFYSNSSGSWVVTGSGGTVELQFRSNHQSTLRGYVYADTSNNIGFLNDGGSWALRMSSTRNAEIFGSDLTIGAGGANATNIIMGDNDEGSRTIHCNSNRIGFLNQSSSWGSWCYDDGSWATDVAMYSPIYYDSDDTAFYVDPNSSSRVRNLYVGDSGSNWVDTGGWGTQFHVSNGPHSILKVFARNEGIETGLFSHVGGQSKVGSFSNHDFSVVRNWDNRMTFYSGYTYANGYLQAADSLRAPIFYDSNDTTYFLDPNADFAMRVYGEICNSNYAEGKMQPGALNIGRTDTNYAWDGGSWASDVRLGLLANTSETWEFGIHDSGDSVMSVVHFDGGSTLTMGRNLGWGQCVVNAPAGYVSNGNAWGTANSAFFPNGITTAGGTNWIYGTTTFIGNAPGNGAGHDFSSSGHQYSTGSITTPLFLVNNHSDNTRGYRIHNTSGSSVSAMFVNSSNQLVIAAGAVDQVNLNKKVLVNGVALGVNVAPSATAGRIDASNDIVAYSSSDERLKYNIAPIENALDKVKSLKGVEFDWKPEHKEAHGHEGRDTGIIAQQVLAVMPTAVRTNDTGYLAVRYEKLIGLLIEGMKEQQTQIDELKAKLDGLTK